MRRRDLLRSCAAAVLCGLASHRAAAQAETWPNRPVRLIVPYGPEGGSDMIARLWSEKLERAFGQPFAIDNRPGAGGMLGAEAGAKAVGDGYALLLTPNGPLTILPHLRKTSYDPQQDLLPVARVGDFVCGFVIDAALGIKTFGEMLAYARANPGRLSFGSSGVGSGNHLRLEMLKYRTGIDIAHVAYRGGADALNDLLAGKIQMMNEINTLTHVRDGKLVLLNLNHPARSSDWPDTPTLSELGYAGADEPIWYSIFAPAGTPKPIIAKLNAKIAEIVKSADMQPRLHALSIDVPIQTPDEIGSFLAEDSHRNGDLIRATKIRLE